jgi:hypothetical protein
LGGCATGTLATGRLSSFAVGFLLSFAQKAYLQMGNRQQPLGGCATGTLAAGRLGSFLQLDFFSLLLKRLICRWGTALLLELVLEQLQQPFVSVKKREDGKNNVPMVSVKSILAFSLAIPARWLASYGEASRSGNARFLRRNPPLPPSTSC